MKNILLAVVFVFIANVAFATETPAATGQAEATIVSTLAIVHTNNAKLQFGTLVSPNAAATVTIGKDSDTPTYSGIEKVATGGIAPSRDRFDVTNDSGVSYSVNLPTSAVTLQGSVSGSMTVDGFVASCTTGCTGTELYVGGVLHVGAQQPAGTYSGSYNVHLTY